MARAFTVAGCTLLLVSTLQAQNVPARLRGRSSDPAPAPAPASPAPAAPPSTLVANQTAPSLLQQPAQEAKIVFDDRKLTIHADNSSLAGILRQIAFTSGMKIEGLGADERVFGTFGPGAPSDVLADLLDGTAYNVALIGDLSNGAPRQLLLTPATHGGSAAPSPATAVNNANSDDSNEADTDVPPPPPEIPQQPPSNQAPPPSGVRTPQQLFEQLQHMRQLQQQQQPPVQQDSPQQ